MYLPSCTYYVPKSDFGSITSPFLTENGTALKEDTEYRGYCYPEHRQQLPSPRKWDQGIQPPPKRIFNSNNNCFLYGRSVYGAPGPCFHSQASDGAPRSFTGLYSASNPPSQVLLPSARNGILPSGIDPFFETIEGGAVKTENTHEKQRENELNRAEWRGCHSGESKETKAGSELLEAVREEDEDAALSSSTGEDCSYGRSKSSKLIDF
ncbi:hypothetical protein LDENG_00233890 [Lucifuga dentata]|nr:hypothetical protein LDENG_00233890 [Lucifuga dentata]